MIENPRVLVIRLSSLGDIVLTTPVYRNLKLAWPAARISVLVKPAYAAVLQGHPHVDEVIPFRGLWDALREMRRREFTHLLDLHANLRSWVLTALSGIPKRLRYRKAGLWRRLHVLFGTASPMLQKHTIDRYLEPLSAWGVPVKERMLELGDARSRPFEEEALPEAASLREILVLQTAFLGDAVLTRPLLEGLKAAFPAARLTVVARPETIPVFSDLCETVTWDSLAPAGGLLRVFRLAAAIRARGCDLAVIPHRSFRAAFIAWLAGIPYRVGFDSSQGRIWLTHRVPFAWPMHDLERNLTLLAPFGKTPPSPRLTGTAPKDAAASIAGKLQREDCEGRTLIGVHPGSAWPTKRWPAERFAELIRRLCRNPATRVILIGGRQDRELCEQVRRDAGVGVCHDWAGETTLPELMALMPRLSLFVTNDSGPMHVATAFGVPTLAIFGPTTRELGFFPYGEGNRVVEVDLECRPCALHGGKNCPLDHFLCMRLITVGQVHGEALALMARSKTAAERR